MQKTWLMTKGSRKKSWQWFVVGLLAPTTFLAPNLAAGPIAALTGNACQQTAVAALTSCKAGHRVPTNLLWANVSILMIQPGGRPARSGLGPS